MEEPAEGSEANPIDARFAEFAATRDPALRAALLEDHLWLARHAARRFNRRGVELDDLEQVASFALIKALDRFDPATGHRFATFAMPTMLGELRRHFRDKTWALRVPRRLKELHLELRSATDELTALLGRSPSVDELAEELDATPEEVLEALEAGASYRVDTLDRPTGENEDLSIVPGTDDPRMVLAADRTDLDDAINELSERDRRILYLRYYLDLTQAEIAEHVGVSQVHVSRILRSTLTRLRTELTDDAEEPTA